VPWTEFQKRHLRIVAAIAQTDARAAVASGAQAHNATNDTVATTAAVILFWPAAFLIKGSGANAQEVAQLKGDMDAIEQANIESKMFVAANKNLHRRGRSERDRQRPVIAHHIGAPRGANRSRIPS
jgi:hypothetical protein